MSSEYARKEYLVVVKATQRIAKEHGIMWEEEQAEVALELLREVTESCHSPFWGLE
tara:strand:+ start:390 stop:557 length:168 start_codon:yes stop_codon:yes gene_type:complete